ncbi:MAG: alkaline phosphatase family protein [Nocardioidaceae bacterium]
MAATTVVPANSVPAAESAGEQSARTKPTRVLVIVLDALRPEFIDAFGMHNVKALMAGGANYPNAYLGHMASETVVSHNVMTSGQLPKHRGWADEWYRDVDGVLGPRRQQYVSGSMSREQFNALIDHAGYPKIQDYLHRRSRTGSRRRSVRSLMRSTASVVRAPTSRSRSAGATSTVTATASSTGVAQ